MLFVTIVVVDVRLIRRKRLPAETFKNVLDSVAKHFGTKDIMINVTGGEPLMRKDLFEITGYADKLGFKWGLVTNGMLITDEVIEKMKKRICQQFQLVLMD